MGMRVIYMAHPVSGDVHRNLAHAQLWYRRIQDVNPLVSLCAHWMVTVWVRTDEPYTEESYDLHLRWDEAVVARCDGIVLVGGKITRGMARERAVIQEAGKTVYDLTHLGDSPVIVNTKDLIL